MEWITENICTLLYGGVGLLLIIFYIRQRKRIRTFLLGSISGLSALILLHFYGGFIGFTPPLSVFNLVFSAILGIPGVVLLFLSELFL
ncbi:MAG: hypothetical protein E7504_02570 [Ruminococcus sp.]|nr:hypothetical protein [Ruminococcus sp.]